MLWEHGDKMGGDEVGSAQILPAGKWCRQPTVGSAPEAKGPRLWSSCDLK